MADIANPLVLKFIERARVARLATLDSMSRPHLVPVVFVFDGGCFFIPVDEKKKTVEPERLKRVRNIQANPDVALLIDRYDEDWNNLAFVMIQGKASIERKGHIGAEPLQKTYKKLMAKYPQYQKVGIGKVCIMVRPEKVTSWSNDSS